MRRKPACTYNRGRKLAHGLHGCINRVARTPGWTEWLSVNDRNRRSPVVDCAVTSVVRRPQRAQEPPYVGFVRIKVGDPDEPSHGVPALSTSSNFISVVTITSPALPSIGSQKERTGFSILRNLRLFRRIEDILKNFEKLRLMEMYRVFMYEYHKKITRRYIFSFSRTINKNSNGPDFTDWNKCNSYSEADWTNFIERMI